MKCHLMQLYQLESYKSVVFARGGPLWFGSNNRLKCSAVPVAAIVANVCYWSAPLQSLYRYFIVCRQKTLSVYTTLAVQLAIVIILGIPGIPYFLDYTPLDQSPKNLALLRSLHAWANEADVADTFCFLELVR
uniref:G_PROTEIN_RECEP_F1_2 domain-containing protein n=1 Tax=Panagrellus redivivus TaxID=6233 RepID=A0A7E4UXF6_PANRE